MKRIPPFALLAVLIAAGASAGLLLQPTTAQNEKKKPQTWEDRKAERFKPIEDHDKLKLNAAAPAVATVEPKKERKILVFYRCETFIHTSIPSGNYALERAAKTTGAYTMDLADTYDVFTKENLAQYDAIVLNNTTSLRLENDEQREALADFVKSGKGLVGIHAAGDNFYQWEEGAKMIGGQFTGHPWTAGGTYAFQLDDPEHPVNKAFDGKGFWHTDEIYWYKPETYVGPEKLRLLVSLDMTKEETRKPMLSEKLAGKLKEMGGADNVKVPVSWVRTYGEGRVFYTNIGHREDAYMQPVVMQHIVDGIQFALGDLEADATPTSELDEVAPAPAPEKE